MISKLEVRLQQAPDRVTVVGTLAQVERRLWFEYAPSFLEDGPELSPVKLPKVPGLLENRDRHAGALPGVFDDSLPDGWGLLLMDRAFRQRGIDPTTVSPLDRLAFVGDRGMGALTYHPAEESGGAPPRLDLRALALNAEAVYEGEADEVVPALIRAGGSPGGARPKVLVGMCGERMLSGEADLPPGYEHWMVKFAARPDLPDAGPVEYAYSLMARAAGIPTEATRLIKVDRLRRYFAVRRFDRRPANRRWHVHTFGNMIHANFRVPGNDYQQLLKITRALTRNHADVIRAFRQMVFNIAAHNRDDHVKNFAYVMSPEGDWALSPAFDLTYSSGPGGEHTMSVLGEGRSPGPSHCLELAQKSGIKRAEAVEVFDQIHLALARWPEFAAEAGCTSKRIQEIARKHRSMAA